MSFLQDKIFILKGQVQHYAWGGLHFIPELLGIDNGEQKPFAEYWMGAHHSASSVLCTKNGELFLQQLIKDHPEEFLGKKVYQQFGGLPYLFKVQDVKEMLSIQVHPSKKEAALGFEEEETKGISIGDAKRNYKDKNHKPEVLLSVGEFWLLHGFLKEHLLKETLANTPEFKSLVTIFEQQGYKGIYTHVMQMPQTTINEVLKPLVQRELNRKKQNVLTKQQPGWWVTKLYENVENISDIDRGVFSIYFFNIVKVNDGEALFQDAGVPHAYLEGQTMELMANSDNVLRGGLTLKHIDTKELLKHIAFESIVPNVMKGDELHSNEKVYDCPVADFRISKIYLNKGEQLNANSSSFEIWFVMQGEIKISGTNKLYAKRGQAIAILANEFFSVTAHQTTTVYKAYVP